MYQVFVKDPSTSDLYELPYISASFNEELNVGKDAKFVFDFNSVKEVASAYNKTVEFIFSGALREIYIQKGSKKIYSGVVSDYDLSKNANGDLNLNIASVGFFSLLGKRRTGAKREFSNTDAGDIAWTLINESQISDTPYSDLGITRGSHPTTKNRDRTFRFANIKDEITQMSNDNLKDGFDFDIDNDKKFNIYFPTRGTQRSEIILDDRNIVSWSYRRPGPLSLTNQVYVLGDGFNDDVLYVKRTSSTDYRSSYKLLEDVLSARDIITTDTLNDKGDRFLLDNQSPLGQLTISHLDDEPDITSYDLGDSVRVQIDELNINLTYFRVVKRNIQIDNSGLMICTLNLQ